MLVDVCNDVFDCHRFNHLLKCVLLSVDLVVLLDLEELAPLGVVLKFLIEELRLFYVVAFEVLEWRKDAFWSW